MQRSRFAALPLRKRSPRPSSVDRPLPSRFNHPLPPFFAPPTHTHTHTHIQSSWLPELQRVVGCVNEAFGAAFRDIGCAGEVHLDEGGGDYAKFSVQVTSRSFGCL